MHQSLTKVGRTKAFQTVISRVVQPGNSVLVCESGVGILPIFAAKTGGEVISIESNKAAYISIKKNIKHAGLSFHCINDDPASYKGHVNVVIIDLLDTMLLFGDQVRVINALVNKSIINNYTEVIPLKVNNFFELVQYNYDFYGNYLPIPADDDDRCMVVCNEAVMYKELVFKSKIDSKCSYKGKHLIVSKGLINAIKFSTIISVDENVLVDNMRHIYLPLEEQLYVRAGDVVNVNIEYSFGSGQCDINVSGNTITF